MKLFFIKSTPTTPAFSHPSSGRRGVSGFALLFSVLIISVIATVAFGLANIIYKQKLLTSVAVDSGKAFYMADSGMECALYTLSQVSTQATPIVCLDPAILHHQCLMNSMLTLIVLVAQIPVLR